MITGKEFSEELLKLLNIPKNQCIVETEESDSYSETLYKAKGISKIILRGDDKKTSSIVIAAHEVGHFLNNRNNYKKYLLFKWGGYVWISIVIFASLMVFLELFFDVVPTALLYSAIVLTFICSLWISFIKVKDEDGANTEALKVLNQNADTIFLLKGDARKWALIQNEAEKQLEEGLKKYKSSNWIIYVLGLLPAFLYFFSLIIGILLTN